VGSPLMARMALVLGVLGVAVGAAFRWKGGIEGDWGGAGLVALMALGLLLAVTGLFALLQERPPTDERAHAHQRAVDRAAWRATIAPVAAVSIMLAFFWLTDRWDNLSNPVQSQIALIAGVIGGLLALLTERISRWDYVIVPVGLIVALLLWGDRLPLDSESTTSGQMVALLVIAILIIGIAINLPQILRGRRTRQTA
jgi:hypothetical protein